MAYARGKYAKAISDRSGMEFPYNEMVKEWNGSFVHKSEFEAKQPQLEPRPHGGDAQTLKNSRTCFVCFKAIVWYSDSSSGFCSIRSNIT